MLRHGRAVPAYQPPSSSISWNNASTPIAMVVKPRITEAISHFAFIVPTSPAPGRRSLEHRVADQHDTPHWSAARSLNTGQQLGPAGEPATAVMAHAGEDIEERPVSPRRVTLVDRAHLAAAVALDPQKPRREGAERVAQGLGGRGEGSGAIGPPMAFWRLPETAHGRFFSLAVIKLLKRAVVAS